VAQKHQNFGLHDLIAIISRWEQDIINRKTALETAITPLSAYQIWRTLVHKWRKIDSGFDPLNQLFQTLISQGLLSLIPSGSVGGIAPNFPTWCVPLRA